ncbi:hypothetical protein HYS31_00960 [Candidatus Woesearchaeota archaeon]|nr:hypothetical protein [Candidatus Woesearchaeota archaeon]
MVGNIPNFTKIDVLRCFLRLEKNMGRQELARELELGEGTVRTILEELKSKNLLDSTKKGHFLSRKGQDALKKMLDAISHPKLLEAENLYPEYRKIGVLVKKASNIQGLYKLRDIAVRNGADGAIILKFDGRLYAPESDFEQDYKEIEGQFDFKDNDTLIIAFSNARRQAENGALSIAIELSSELKSFINEL